MTATADRLKYSFIIGIGRSGTTVLTQILNQHSQIHCLPEANFLVFFLNTFKGNKKVESVDLDEIFDQISCYRLSHPWVGWEFDLNKTKAMVRTVCEEKTGLAFEELCRLI